MPRIVVIDDDETWAESAAELLRDAGYETAVAGDGHRGLDLIEKDPPHAVVLDVHMPRMGGLEVMSELRQQGVRVPILVVSADDHTLLIADAMAAGAMGFLRKPLPPELLVRAIRRLVPLAPQVLP